MNSGRSIFAQLIDHLPIREFRKYVDRYDGNRRVRSFSFWDQLLCLVFAQLTCRESLRDIVACLRSVDGRLYHMGIRGTVSRSTLADANEGRDWRIYADFAQVLIQEARHLYAGEDFGVDLANTVYAFDSTTIDLCMALFPWASYKRPQHALKLHTLLDLRGNIPTFIRITPARLHDVNVLDALTPEAGSVLCDGSRLRRFRAPVPLDSRGRVLRDTGPKEPPVRARLLGVGRQDDGRELRSDDPLVWFYSSRGYPGDLRRIRYLRRRRRTSVWCS